MADTEKLSREEIKRRQMGLPGKPPEGHPASLGTPVVTCRGCFAVLSAEDAEEETRKTGYCGVCRARGRDR